MVGGLIENRTQIAVASFYKSQSRMQVITLSESIAQAVFRFNVKFPERELNWTTFLDTFDFEVWICLSMLVFLFLVCLYISQMFLSQKEANDDKSFNVSNTFLVVHCVRNSYRPRILY